MKHPEASKVNDKEAELKSRGEHKGPWSPEASKINNTEAEVHIVLQRAAGCGYLK